MEEIFEAFPASPFIPPPAPIACPAIPPENMPPCIAGYPYAVASVAAIPAPSESATLPPRLSSAACSTRWRSTLRALLLMAFCPRLYLAPATAPALSPLPLFDRPTWPLLMDPLDVRGCGTGPAAPFSVERSAYVEGAMRTNVVSCDSAAVTLLLGVLHVPQLYSLSRIHERGNAGGSAYASRAGGTG